MKKDDLRAGMIVELRDGDKGIVLLNTEHGDLLLYRDGWNNVGEYEDDLTAGVGFEEFDIIKVYQPSHKHGYAIKNWGLAKLIWERPADEPTITIKGKEYSESTIIAALKNHLPEEG